MFNYRYTNNIIENYVFNCLKKAKISFQEIEYIKKNIKHCNFLLKYLLKKEIEIYTDSLTYLFNKKFYLKFIMPFSIQKEDEWDNLSFFWNSSFFKAKDKIYYILIDIGNFKKINDSLSYKTGDYLLRIFSYFLIKEKIEFIIRNGGDEFVLITSSLKKTTSLLKKIEDISFIKKLNYTLHNIYLLLEKKVDIVESSLIKEHNLIYVGAGFSEINLNKIRKYIKNRNINAYHQYMKRIENNVAEYMKKNKQKIKSNINIIPYR